MARCWTCGASTEKAVFTCTACNTLREIQGLRRETADNLGDLTEIQRRGFEELSHTLSDGLSEIASAIEWGFEELSWQLHQQTSILKNIDHTLKTPSQTQANEWRVMAEELRSRGVLDKSEEFFLKSLDANPLDYRIYVGLAQVYLQTDKFDAAKDSLEQSLPHAPRGSFKRMPKNPESWSGEEINEYLDQMPADTESMSEDDLDVYFESLERELKQEERAQEKVDMPDKSFTRRAFDYKSYSYRMIGHIYACKEDYSQAVLALETAVNLSPKYHEAVYDLAQYSAQVGDETICLSAVKSVIEADSFYFYLVRKERNFEPLSVEVTNLLDKISIDAANRAKRESSKSKEKIKLAENSIADALKVMPKNRYKDELLADSRICLDRAKSKVKLAVDKINPKDYGVSLGAIATCKDAASDAEMAQRQAIETGREYLGVSSNQRSEVLSELYLTFLGGIVGGAFLGAIPGCAAGCFINPLSSLTGALLGAILGVIIGIILAGREAAQDLHSANDMKQR